MSDMKIMKKILAAVLIAVSFPVLGAAQAQLTTRKVKIEDFTEKVTKVVLTGNVFFDATFEEEIKNRWVISPYEFCTLEEFDQIKTDPDYYFLIKVKGQFRRESEPGLEFLSVLKGGPEAEKGLDRMMDLITFPLAAADSPSGRETVFLPLILDIIQQHIISSTETDLVAYSSLGAYSNNLGHIRDCLTVLAEDDLSSEITPVVRRIYIKSSVTVEDTDVVDRYVADNAPGTVVSYTVYPEDPQPGSFCYKMLIDVENSELCYFRKHRITRKTGPGFLLEDIKRIAEFAE